nr:MAG TPA: hypothetical protein [Caudoviricetes sp.]
MKLHHQNARNAPEGASDANNAKPEQTIICISTEL